MKTIQKAEYISALISNSVTDEIRKNYIDAMEDAEKEANLAFVDVFYNVTKIFHDGKIDCKNAIYLFETEAKALPIDMTSEDITHVENIFNLMNEPSKDVMSQLKKLYEQIFPVIERPMLNAILVEIVQSNLFTNDFDWCNVILNYAKEIGINEFTRFEMNLVEAMSLVLSKALQKGVV